MKKFLLFLPAVFVSLFESKAQSAFSTACDQGFFYYNTTPCGILSRNAETFSVGVHWSVIGTGLAIGPNLGFNAPNPTLWMIGSNGNYYYRDMNGGFVNTGHSAGGACFSNPGGSGSYIYNYNPNGQISVYSGSGNATVLTTVSEYTGSTTVNDIVGDLSDNFYLFKVSPSPHLAVFNSQGVLTCTYAVSGSFNGSTGLAIVGGKVLLSFGSSVYSGQVNGNSINFSLLGNHCQVDDMASCPASAEIFPSINPAQPTLTCYAPTAVLSTPDDNAGAYTYLWSGPGLGGIVSSHSLLATQPGVYTRTVISCMGTKVSTVSVISDIGVKPLYVSQSSTVYCQTGSPVTLLVNGLGNYTWSPANSLSAPIGAQVSAFPQAPTTYTVMASLNGCTGSTVVTLNSANPNAVINPVTGSLCAGDAIVLSTQSQGAILWQPGNLTSAQVAVSPVSSTVYTLTVTDAEGCTAASSQPITVVPVPLLSVSASTNAICQGKFVTVTLQNAWKYVIQPGNLSGSSLLLMPSATTQYTITGSNWNCSDEKHLTITVHPLPKVNVQSTSHKICAGESVTLTATGADSYIWFDGSPSATMVVSPLTYTSYNVTGKTVFGCSDSGSKVIAVDECTSVSSLPGASAFAVYPNPAFNLIKVKGLTPGDLVELTDAAGRVLLSEKAVGEEMQLDLSALNSGVYLLRTESKVSRISINY